ncbi:MAG TPA: hypothetical protein VNT42_06455 [Sphingomonas sp.]|nr:hypothetical protein [Sphingomonas sp.]
MLGILALTAAAALPAPSKTDVQIKDEVCQKPGPHMVKEQEGVRAQKLNELPNADQYLTVFRSEGRCSKPVIVRYDIGSAPKTR